MQFVSVCVCNLYVCIMCCERISHLCSQLLLSDDLKVIEVLVKVCKDHPVDLASSLIHIFCAYDRVVPLINACLGKSVENTGSIV